MEWWRKLVFPVRRFLYAASARVKARKNGAGLLKLHNDIQTCGYEDVQIMWEMLRRTESESEPMPRHTKRRQRWLSRNFVWSNHHRKNRLSDEKHRKTIEELFAAVSAARRVQGADYIQHAIHIRA
ncbi:uncharacterized protein Fot_08471 [Forsythia ovata]|uniref:Uncharacterized protein n=1 Tax=Forsythia ovata TaxID=205694 RepID=A0ABD1WZ82_9LAMI